MQTTFLPYAPDLERVTPDEESAIATVVATMRDIAEKTDDRYRHALRSVHSKNHGIAIGRLEIPGGLPEHLAQGLFAKPGDYPALVRFSTNPGEFLPDSVSTARGFALKIVGIENEAMVAGHEAVGPADFLKQMQFFDRHLGNPAEAKVGVSAATRIANGVLSAIGKPSTVLATMGGHPATHPLTGRFFTQAPNRFGAYVAKFSLEPESSELLELERKTVDLADYSALRNEIAHFFAVNGGTWLLRAQLAVDIERTPIEDMSVEWKADVAPFETVGRLILAPQHTDTAERRVYGDDLASFDPWHALDAHRPLGGIQRARRAAYAQLSNFRFGRNVREKREPRTASDLPA